MSADIDAKIKDYLVEFLLRYFRKAVSVTIGRLDSDAKQDLYLLKLHWSVSKPIEKLIEHLRKNPHEVTAVLESRLCEDDARVRGRFNARGTAIRQMMTGHPTLIVSHEPLRAYRSGPNHVLIWVLEQARRLALEFQSRLPEYASYLEEVEKITSALETARRFDAIQHAAKQLDLTRRPSSQAVKEARRSRRPIYRLACAAYQFLEAVESGDEEAIIELLNDTLLAPRPAWQRFELAVGLGLTRALSDAHGQPASLKFLSGGSQPIATVGEYAVYWQLSTDVWREPERELSEKILLRLFEQYGFKQGLGRPDLVILSQAASKAVAVVEVKYFKNKEDNGEGNLKGALSQIVRYARGYRDPDNLDDILDHSIVALAYFGSRWNPDPKPYGLPLVVDFDGILRNHLNEWACRLPKYFNSSAAGFG